MFAANLLFPGCRTWPLLFCDHQHFPSHSWNGSQPTLFWDHQHCWLNWKPLELRLPQRQRPLGVPPSRRSFISLMQRPTLMYRARMTISTKASHLSPTCQGAGGPKWEPHQLQRSRGPRHLWQSEASQQQGFQWPLGATLYSPVSHGSLYCWGPGFQAPQFQILGPTGHSPAMGCPSYCK